MVKTVTVFLVISLAVFGIVVESGSRFSTDELRAEGYKFREMMTILMRQNDEDFQPPPSRMDSFMFLEKINESHAKNFMAQES